MALNQDAAITISIVAKDLASGNISKAVAGMDELAKKGGMMGSVMQGVGQSFGQMINPMALVGQGISAVTDFLADGVRSAIDEEASLKRLDTALENNVEGWDGNRDAIDKAIESSMNLGFQDDVLRDSMVKLVTASGNVDESLKNQRLAMDIARGKNIDLAAATDIVIKASMGNTKALKAMGIELQKGATKTEILAELQKRFGGQAAEYADTTAGAMEAAQVAIGEVAEDIGAMLLPEIKKAADFIRDDLIPAIGAIGAAWDATFGALDRVGADLSAQAIADTIDRIAASTGKSREEIERLWNSVTEGGQPALHMMATTSLRIEALAATSTGLAHDVEAEMSRWATTADLMQPFVEAQRHAATRQQANAAGIGAYLAGEMGDRYGQVLIQNSKDKTAEAMSGIADTLRGSRDVIKDAMDDVAYVQTHQWEIQVRLSEIAGILMGDAMAEGLSSTVPGVAAVWADARRRLTGEWFKLTGDAFDAGRDAGYAWLRGYSSVELGVRDRDRYTGDWTPNSPKPRKKRAAGGPTAPHEAYLVGEDRPELLVMGDRGGYVYPDVPSRTAAASSRLEFHFHYHGVTMPSPAEQQRIAQTLMPGFVREAQRQRIQW